MPDHRLTLLHENALVARDGDVYIAGQPEPADLDAWAALGVKRVVNLRSRAENAELPFDPPAEMKARGMDYVEVPMGGADGVSPKIREAVSKALESAPGPVVLHCRTGPRAVYAYAAHLIANGEARAAEIAKLGWPGPLDPATLAALGAK
jgi:uncharacterized protein (TIGR01244 family)